MTQEEFDAKLESLGVKEQFYVNLDGRRASDIVFRAQDFQYDIAGAFTWDSTEEGHTFWQKISETDFSRLEEYPEEYYEYLSKR